MTLSSTPRTKKEKLAKREADLQIMKENNWRIDYHENGEIIICRCDEKAILAKAYTGYACKPKFFYRFRTLESREKFLEERLAFYKKQYGKEKPSRKSPDASDHYMVGDVLYDSWGYDQTNIDWFQVTKVKGKSIWLRRIAENNSDPGNCSYGYTQPRRYEFIGSEFRKRVMPDGHVSSALRGCLFKWDGKPKYCSTYH